jgi:hypothetical protein
MGPLHSTRTAPHLEDHLHLRLPPLVLVLQPVHQPVRVARSFTFILFLFILVISHSKHIQLMNTRYSPRKQPSDTPRA